MTDVARLQLGRRAWTCLRSRAMGGGVEEGGMWQDNAHGALVLREAGGVGRWEERRERVAKGRRGLKRLIMPPMGCELMLARMRSDRAPAHGF